MSQSKKKPKSKLWQSLSTSAFDSAQFASRTTAWLIIQIGTLPYYRMFNFNTLMPILHLSQLTSDQTRGHDHLEMLLRVISRWRDRKLAELQFISVACAVLAGAVIGSFSWFTMPNAYWLAPTFWYCSLSLSILGILTSAQQVSVLGFLGALPHTSDHPSARDAVLRYLPVMLGKTKGQQDAVTGQDKDLDIGVWRPKWRMVFTWQCAMMFMSYSVCLFLLGLTILVCTPLIHGGKWDVGMTTAVVYLVVSGAGGAAFMFCSFWGFHYVDITVLEVEDFQISHTSKTMHAGSSNVGE